MNRTFILLLLVALFIPAFASAHCQMPCGIYDDQSRIDQMREDITTMEKGMNQINSLSAKGDKNYNQIVRWVNTKEMHADKFSEIVTQYFMTQRLKPTAPDSPDYAKYEKQLDLLHGMLVSAMKCKQTTDLAHIEKLKELVNEFEKIYIGEHTH